MFGRGQSGHRRSGPGKGRERRQFGATMMLITIVLGGALALMIIAPWGRASWDCSMWCVLDQEVKAWFSDEPF